MSGDGCAARVHLFKEALHRLVSEDFKSEQCSHVQNHSGFLGFLMRFPELMAYLKQWVSAQFDVLSPAAASLCLQE